MKLDVRPFDEQGRKRITQLINKSNQFNLTTRRYSEREVAVLEDSPEHKTYQIRVTDHFGDNGVVSIVIVEPRREEWHIDTWLMSCRVLGRRVEEGVLSVVVGEAKKAGATTLVGVYKPTSRNAMVSDHYKKLGFMLAHEEEGVTRWSLDIDTYEAPRLPMTVVSEDGSGMGHHR